MYDIIKPSRIRGEKHMDSKEKNSFKDLENKRNNFDNSRSLCTKSREEDL